MRRMLALALAATLVGLTGCAMMGGEDEGASSGAPRNVDSVRLRSGDVLVGEVAFPNNRLQLSNEVLPDLVLEKRHLETLRVLPDGRIKVSTKHGDQIQGRLEASSITLQAKTGGDMKLDLADVDRVTFAE